MICLHYSCVFLGKFEFNPMFATVCLVCSTCNGPERQIWSSLAAPRSDSGTEPLTQRLANSQHLFPSFWLGGMFVHFYRPPEALRSCDVARIMNVLARKFAWHSGRHLILGSFAPCRVFDQVIEIRVGTTTCCIGYYASQAETSMLVSLTGQRHLTLPPE